MKTNMQATSLMSFWGEIYPSLQPRQKEVLDVFRWNPGMDFTNNEIKDELNNMLGYGLDSCSITGRVWSLRGKGKNNPFALYPFLIESRKRKCRSTGRTAIAWQLNNK